jgi:uncharacterized glyoxalase superfamily protein PhnB
LTSDPRPSISLREQAEQFVRWHRDRHWTVAQVIRNLLPRYGHLTDGQVLEAEFGIADAQELVALREGFKDWDALVAASRGETAPAEPAALRVLVARPFVFVRDVHAACAYYVEKLGFTLAFDYGKPPFYAEVERDGVRLCVRHTDEPMIDRAAAAREGGVWIASLEVSDAKALYEEFLNAGAVISQPLKTEPFGARDFSVEDPDGNSLGFFDLTRRTPPS